MDKIRCSKCGAEHDLSQIELSFDQPDAYFHIPHEERRSRVVTNDDVTVIDDGTPATRFFVRGVLVIPVRGETRDGFGWGVWTEVGEAEFERVIATQESRTQSTHGPLVGQLANELGSFPGSLGLPIHLRLKPPGAAPEIDILPRDHPLGAVQQHGAYLEDVLEWLSPILH